MKPILFLEDDPDDIWLTQRAIKTAHLEIVPSFVVSCAELKKYIEASASSSGREHYPLPHMALIDLKLKASSGFEALRYFAWQETLRHIPVIVLTSSGRLEDRALALSLGARDFITKPANNTDLAAVLVKVVRDHLMVGRLPGSVSGTTSHP